MGWRNGKQSNWFPPWVLEFISKEVFRDERYPWWYRSDKIPLKLDAKPIKQRPYRLNPKYKQKVGMELDKMLAAGIIELVEESEWVSPMVFQEKKTKG